jgi:metal-sulfur cluster biosynthetic enzyme
MTATGHPPIAVEASAVETSAVETSTVGTITPELWAALGRVRDPELDEPITDLGFVTEATISDGVAGVRLRLPTYFCAPNFAYLMVADAYDAVLDVPGVRRADVRLEDHFASDEINAGVAAGSGFKGSFPGLADDELAQLRLTFQRKAHAACLDRASRALLREGWTVDALSDASLSDLPQRERDALVRRRAQLGLPRGPAEPLLVDDHGHRVPADRTAAHLRFATAVRVSIEGNAGLCRGLLRTRYPEPRDRIGPGTEDAGPDPLGQNSALRKDGVLRRDGVR